MHPLSAGGVWLFVAAGYCPETPYAFSGDEMNEKDNTGEQILLLVAAGMSAVSGILHISRA